MTDAPFSFTTELAPCPWNQANRLLLIGLQAKKIPVEQMPPSNLVFLLDVSGSMDAANKLPLLKGAFKLLVNQMRAKDRVAIVVYAGAEHGFVHDADRPTHRAEDAADAWSRTLRFLGVD